MKQLLLFFIISYTLSEVVTNATVDVYFNTLGEAYLNYEGVYVNKIVNQQDFKLSAGYGKATFEIKDHNIFLEHFYPQPQKNEKESQTSYSPMYGKTLYVAILRAANRRDPTKCTPIEKAREYVKYVELGMRIWSANQIRLSQGNDLYISSKCLSIEDSLYNLGYETIMNNLIKAAEKDDETPNAGVRWFITDDFPGDWMGLSANGNPSIVANRYANYWLICKHNPTMDDPGNEKLTTLMHEYGHSCGFGHGGRVDVFSTGAFTTFKEVDNYKDCANIMGDCAPWDRTITASQYWQVVVSGKAEPWEFIYPDVGTHKYRLYAFDHPYSRYFLGTNVPFHDGNEVIDGIPFKYNCLGIRVLVNKTLTSKYTGNEGSSGSIMFEYKWNPNGQQSAQDFGIRITYGFGSKSNLLMANLDNSKSWGDSEIMTGVDYYPADFDTGTLRVRVTKIHKTVLKEQLEKEIVKETKRNYDEPGYVELEIEFYPNKKPPAKGPPPKDFPEFVYSPSFYNCAIRDDGSGIRCLTSTTFSGWYYIKNTGNRNRNVPRLYTNVEAFIRGRNALRSYNGWDFSHSKVCYGDDGFRCITMNVVGEDFRGVVRKNYQNAKVTRVKINDANQTIEDMGVGNVLFGRNLFQQGRAYITDLFGNEKDIKVEDKGFVEFLPPLVTDGFSEGAVVVKNKDGKVIYYDSFTFYNPINDNRVAIEFKENGEIAISPAVIPSNRFYTTTALLFSITLKADNWFVYPILNLRDNDYVLFDFKGNVPSGLIITIESDMGEYSKDLSDLGGLSSVSYKMTFLELNKETGGLGEIDRIKFNKDVEIQNIRPIYSIRIGNQIKEVKAVKDTFNVNGYSYTIESSQSESTYIYNKVNVEINGETYSFDSSTSSESVKSIGKKGLSVWIIVLIVVGSVVVLIGGICIIKKMKSGKSSRTFSQNAYGNRQGYPNPAAATFRPPVAMGGTYGPGAAATGYAGGYGK